jgi:hypothetical protein
MISTTYMPALHSKHTKFPQAWKGIKYGPSPRYLAVNGKKAPSGGRLLFLRSHYTVEKVLDTSLDIMSDNGGRGRRTCASTRAK